MLRLPGKWRQAHHLETKVSDTRGAKFHREASGTPRDLRRAARRNFVMSSSTKSGSRVVRST